MITQNEAVYDYMEKNGSITPLEAVREIGCLRLSARIYELQKSGIRIKKETVESKNANGKTSRYARYSIINDDIGGVSHDECR